MRILLVILKTLFILAYPGSLYFSLQSLVLTYQAIKDLPAPFSITEVLMAAFVIFLGYPFIIILRSFIKEDVERSKKVLKLSLKVSLIFAFASPFIIFLFMMLPFYSQAFEVLAIPVLFAIGLLIALFFAIILVAYKAKYEEVSRTSMKMRNLFIIIGVIVLVLVGGGWYLLFGFCRAIPDRIEAKKISEYPYATFWRITDRCGWPDGSPYASIYFQTDKTPDEVFQFFKNELARQDWDLEEEGDMSIETGNFWARFKKDSLSLFIGSDFYGTRPSYKDWNYRIFIEGAKEISVFQYFKGIVL